MIEGTDPNNSSDSKGTDIDGDGVPDVVEILQGTDIDNADSYLNSDGGTKSDYLERLSGTDPYDISDDKEKDENQNTKVVVGTSGGSTSPLYLMFLSLFALIRFRKRGNK
ncbi:hypothetical protein A1Q5_05640 [Aliivibrio logei 5S-186]|uniref:GlyGly-CTERM sorting domain-containing protein n=1 Tax=Aliivibrio logei 5S-186 TaxID=626086 RepID=A0ABX3AWP5_ALILO|nr:hypothetical protein A1Q5_05640 [Aliivibrio logei 5S-186]